MKKDIFLVASSHLSQLLAQFLVIRLLTYNFEASLFGIYIIFTGLINISTQVTSFPLNNHLQLKYSFHNYENITEFIFRRFSVLISFLISTIGLYIFNVLSYESIIYAICIIFFRINYNSLLTYYNSKENHKSFFKIKITHNLIYGLTTLFAIKILNLDFKLLVIFIAFVFFIQAILINFFLNKVSINPKLNYKNIYEFLFTKNFRAKLYKYLTYAFPLALIAILTYLSGSSERYFIKAFFNDEMVGIYASLYFIATKPFVFAKGMIEMILRPKMYKTIIKTKIDFYKYHKPWLIISLMVIIFGLIFNIYGWPLYKFLIPKEYLLFHDVLLPLTAAYLPFLYAQYFRRILLRDSKNKNLLNQEIVTTLFTLILYLLIGYKTKNIYYMSFVPLISYSVRLLLCMIDVKRLEIEKKYGN